VLTHGERIAGREMWSKDLPADFYELLDWLSVLEFLNLSAARLVDEGREMERSVGPFSTADYESWVSAGRALQREQQ
jgi:hypothetical protein